jgi:hypothetical protein
MGFQLLILLLFEHEILVLLPDANDDLIGYPGDLLTFDGLIVLALFVLIGLVALGLDIHVLSACLELYISECSSMIFLQNSLFSKMVCFIFRMICSAPTSILS